MSLFLCVPSKSRREAGLKLKKGHIIEVQLIIHVQQNDTCGIILNKNVVFTDEEPHNRWSDMI